MSTEGGSDLKVDLTALVTSLASLMAPSTEAPDPRATFITFNQDTT